MDNKSECDAVLDFTHFKVRRNKKKQMKSFNQGKLCQFLKYLSNPKSVELAQS